MRLARISIDNLHSFFAYYLTDLIFIPMQLTICLIVLRYLKKDFTLKIPISLILTITVAMSILFEWYLPIYKNSRLHTGDFLDVVMYLLGAVVFILVQQKWFLRSSI